MQQLISLEFNLFSMIAVGFLLRRMRLMGKEAEGIITDLVIYVILPCNIFNSFLSSGPDTLASDK